MIFSILNLLITALGLICMGYYLWFLGKAIFHFFPMINNIRDSKYYVFGPLILLSDSFFKENGIKHRKAFILNFKHLILTCVLLGGILIYFYFSYYNQ